MKLEKIVLALLILFVAAYFGAIFFLTGTKITFYFKPFIIPLFLVYAILKNGLIFPKGYLFFVVFFYLGETFMLFSDNSNTVLQLALVFYLMFYFALTNLAFGLISGAHFKKVFTGLTLFVISLIAFFLFLIVYLIFETTNDSITNFIAVLNSISALALIISAVVYRD